MLPRTTVPTVAMNPVVVAATGLLPFLPTPHTRVQSPRGRFEKGNGRNWETTGMTLWTESDKPTIPIMIQPAHLLVCNSRDANLLFSLL